MPVPDFNPDQYLQEKQQAAPTPAQVPQSQTSFDPDKYISEKQGSSPQEPGILHKLAAAYGSFKNGQLNGGTLGYYSPPDPAGVNKEYPTINKIGKFMGGGAIASGVSALAEPLMPVGKGLAAYLGRAGVNAAGAGAVGAAENPGEGSRVTNAVVAAATAGLSSVAAEGAGSTLGKGADYLMQKATGIKKYVPGIGQRLIDMGVQGSKSGMAEQVGSKYADVEDNIQDLVKGLEGNVSTKEIQDAVNQHTSKFLNPDTGAPFAGKEPYVNQIRDTAESLGNTPNMSPEALLKYKRANDWVARNNSGNIGASLDSELSNTQANGARSALYKLSPEVQDQMQNERALIMAKKGLSAPDTINKSPISLSDIGMSGIGGAIGSGPGAVAGLAVSKAAKSPYVQSALAHGFSGGANASKAVADPETLQALVGGITGAKNKTTKDPED